MGQKWGFCRRVRGWGLKSPLFWSKRSTFLGVIPPPNRSWLRAWENSFMHSLDNVCTRCSWSSFGVNFWNSEILESEIFNLTIWEYVQIMADFAFRIQSYRLLYKCHCTQETVYYHIKSRLWLIYYIKAWFTLPTDNNVFQLSLADFYSKKV